MAIHRDVALPCALAGLLLATTTGPLQATGTPAAARDDWNFQALLDGRPIGSHRFSVHTEGDRREVVSEASFVVKFIGITAYRYRHEAIERWRGNCLEDIVADTDDDGKPSRVRLSWPEASGDDTTGRCVMSFAYWNPALRTQTRLLNAQTGKLEAVRIERLENASIEVHRQPCAATGFRITGAGNPIDVWYSAEGQWIGLDSVVAGGRKLSYRLP